jgi:hypothetical protein
LFECPLLPRRKDVPLLAHKGLFSKPLLDALPRTAEGPGPHSSSVPGTLKALKLPQRVILLALDNGVHVRRHVLLNLSAGKLPGGIKLERLELGGALSPQRCGLPRKRRDNPHGLIHAGDTLLPDTAHHAL